MKNKEKKQHHIPDEFFFREELGLLNTAKVDYQKLFDYLASYKKPELITSHENPIKPVFSCEGASELVFSYEGDLSCEAIENILRREKMDKIMTTNTMSNIAIGQREKWSLLSKTSTYFAQSTAMYDVLL